MVLGALSQITQQSFKKGKKNDLHKVISLLHDRKCKNLDIIPTAELSLHPSSCIAIKLQVNFMSL